MWASAGFYPYRHPPSPTALLPVARWWRRGRVGWLGFAVWRREQRARPGVRWLRGDLQAVEGPQPRVDAMFSCGPLDHFARWYARSLVECPRVVAFGSTSVEVKQDSADAAERDLAMRLREGEARSEEHTPELQSLMRISYALFCLKTKTCPNKIRYETYTTTRNDSIHTSLS